MSDIEQKLREQGSIEERLRLPVSESMFARRADMLRALFAERSEAAATIASLRAKLEEAEQRYVDANEARLDCIRALHEVVEAMMPGQARRIARAALSQKETGHGA